MRYEDRYIVELSRAAIFDDVPYEPTEKINWDYVYKKSAEQNITGLLYTSVVRLAIENQPENSILTRWKEIMLQTIAINSKRYFEFLKMYRFIKNANYTFIGLKGCVLRNIYPVPELRTMGDFDVLYSEKETSAIKNFFVKNKYNVTNDVYGLVCKKKECYWELFFSLEDEFRVEAERWTQQIIDESITIAGICCPSYTLFFLHLVLHTSKHFLREGAGIRNLCDIAIFLHNYARYIDFGVVYKVVSQQKMTNIYNYLLNVVIKWYKLDLKIVYKDIEQQKLELFIEYSLSNGIFGKNDNILISQVTKNEDNHISRYRKIFFPSVKILKHRYKYLSKYPFLLPIAWINRFFRAVFKWKYSVKDMIHDFKTTKEYSSEREEYLKKMDLWS